MRISLILAIFLFSVVLMYRRKMNALIGLPAMAILIAACADVPLNVILSEVIAEGALRLHNPIVVIIFGAALAEIVKKSGIVEVLIRNTAEFLGDRKILVSILLMLIVSLLFTVLGGLGAIVMVGAIVFPIMISMGISKLNAACIFLMGLSLGGSLNLMNWSLFTEVLKLSPSEIMRYVLMFFPVALLVAISFIFIELKKEGATSFRLQLKEQHKTVGPSVFAYFTPIVPVVLVFAFGIRAMMSEDPAKAFQFPIIAAMFIGIVYGVLTCPKSAGPKGKLLSRSLFDGIANVAPAVALMIGIGMLLKAVANPAVKALLTPITSSILPTDGLSYVIVFTALAPLALYRGPLNIWGMGSGLVAIIKDAGTIPAGAIMAALMAVGQIQGVSDPTNTYNVWIANYLGTDVVKIMKRTLLYMWIVALLGLLIATSIYY